jgi:hypothetical protein
VWQLAQHRPCHPAEAVSLICKHNLPGMPAAHLSATQAAEVKTLLRSTPSPKYQVSWARGVRVPCTYELRLCPDKRELLDTPSADMALLVSADLQVYRGGGRRPPQVA